MIKLPQPTFKCNLGGKQEVGRRGGGSLAGLKTGNFICRFSCFLLNHSRLFRNSVAASWGLYRTVALSWQFRCSLWIIGGVCHPCNLAPAANAACYLVRRYPTEGNQKWPTDRYLECKVSKVCFQRCEMKESGTQWSRALHRQIYENEIPLSCSSGCWAIRIQRLAFLVNKRSVQKELHSRWSINYSSFSELFKQK